MPSTIALLQDSSFSSIFPLKLTPQKQKIPILQGLLPLVYAAPEIDSRSRNRCIFCPALPAFSPARAPARNNHSQCKQRPKKRLVRGR